MLRSIHSAGLSSTKSGARPVCTSPNGAHVVGAPGVASAAAAGASVALSLERARSTWRSRRVVSDTRPIVRPQAQSSAVPQPSSDPSPNPWANPWLWASLLCIVLAGAGGVTFMSTPDGIALREYLVNGPLGKSGFLAAFSLIFLSEIGDKTFFIAALLAMKLGKWISFFGSLASLGLMTIISVSIGAICAKVPDVLTSSIPIGEIAGVLLLVFFGIKALKEGLKRDKHEKADEEMADAEEVVKSAETSGRMHRNSPFTTFMEVASLIFIAEWGDRSMIATIALGAAQNPFGVAAGAVAGHAIATGIAVVGGAIASKYISEKTINIISGILFLVFAAATAYSMF